MRPKGPWAVLVILFLIIPTLPIQAANDDNPSPPVAVPGFSHRHDVSPPLRDLVRLSKPGVPGPPREIPIQKLDLSKRAQPQPRATDPLLGVPAPPQAPMPPPGISFDGPEADDLPVVGLGRVAPPDTNGDVGPNHYVSFVNLVFEVFNKNTGASVLGPAKGSDLWIGFGGVCEGNNDGDPVVLYDQFAGRWIMTQFEINSGTQCFAVSQTGDPTGAWHRYAFDVSPGNNDYPKLGVWPDGYYLTFNEFAPSFTQAVAVAFEKEKMLLGLPAQFVKFNVTSPAGVGCPGAGDCYFSLQPSHVEGLTPPPSGAPNYFLMAFDDEVWGTSPNPAEDYYKLWKFQVNWTTPSSSTFTGPVSFPTPEFDAELCGFGDCVPQPSPGTALDTLSQFTMFRLVYRKFAGHESLYVNHSVDVGANRAGVRWTEIRSPGAAPAVYQTGTHAPSDGHHRWMGSIAADKDGNLAIGYSISSSTLFPGIRYAGRLSGDPLGTLPQTETSMHEGTGAQQGTSGRWGDYSSLSIDESDDCTFWYTNEYYQTTGSFDWDTRIGKFKFANCTQGPAGTLTGTVTSASNGNPIAGAHIQIGESYSTSTDGNGVYSMIVPVGTYDVTASKFGYAPQTATGVQVQENQTTTQNFALVPSGAVVIDGFVTDGSGAGWPLYARLDFTSSGGTSTVYSDPQTGYYAMTAVADASYTITVTAQVSGYVSQMRAITTGVTDQQENFALLVDQTSCSASGYSRVNLGTVLQTDFSSGIPAGWTVTNSTVGCTALNAIGQWNTANPGLRANLTGGSGLFAIADSDDCGSAVKYDSNMETPAIDLTGFAGSLTVAFNSDYRDLCTPSAGDYVALEAFNGTNWVPVFTFCGPNGGASRRGPRLESFSTTAASGVANGRVRWRYKGGFDWWWEVDNVNISKSECQFQGGGLIYGNVYDANTGLPLNGALVQLDTGQTATTGPTPNDPTVDDGFYIIYAPISPGSVRTMTVSMSRYGTVNRSVIPTPNGSQEQNFNLPAALLVSTPAELRMRLAAGASGNQNLTISNQGGLDGQFSILELNSPGPSSDPGTRFDEIVLPYDPDTKEGQLAAEFADTRYLPIFAPPQVPTAQLAGEHVAEYLTTHALPWGAGYNLDVPDLWVSNPSVGGGDDKNHRYLTNGTYTGDTVNVAGVGGWPADMAYNPRTRSVWQVKVGGDNCIFEIDPLAKVRTGRQICPAFGTSMRGLAYDAVRDIYYAGSWNGTQVVEFTPAGTILRRVNVGLGISGLAFNGSTGHLFAQVNASTQLIYVLDANATGFTALSAFTLSNSSGGNAYGAFSGAGLEIDCAGNLWSVNQTTKRIHVNQSGEQGACVTQIPWLSENPSSGTVAAGGSVISQVTFTAGTAYGCSEAHFVVLNDTPYPPSTHNVGLTVAFSDVAAGSTGDAYIHAFASAGVVTTCGPGQFCPGSDTTRRIMAVWLLRAKLGGNYQPPPATGIFGDVSPESFGAAFIEDLYRRGIDGGCGSKKGVPNFCPEDAVTRGALAKLLLLTKEGSSYQPPPCTGLFKDVPCSDANAAFIEEVYRRGIATSCPGGPPNQLRFCPSADVDRANMALQMGRTFGIVGCRQ